MIFSVNENRRSLEGPGEDTLSELDVVERQDRQEWIIEQSGILGGDLLIISPEYANVQDTQDGFRIGNFSLKLFEKYAG